MHTCELKPVVVKQHGGHPVVVGIEVVADGEVIGLLEREQLGKCFREIEDIETPEGLKEINDWNYLQIGH